MSYFNNIDSIVHFSYRVMPFTRFFFADFLILDMILATLKLTNVKGTVHITLQKCRQANSDTLTFRSLLKLTVIADTSKVQYLAEV
jgi:hypothetical protein